MAIHMKQLGMAAPAVAYLFVYGCVEPFEPEGVEFESALVVEATITDEEKIQEVLLSRTFALDTTGIYGESGAKVSVTGSNGDMFIFSEQSGGKYISQAPFAVVTGVGYQINIETSDGQKFVSNEETVPTPTQIDSLYVERDIKSDDLEEGLFIYVDAYDANSTNNYYRYEYEETYKIFAPYWSGYDAYVISRVPFEQEVGTVLREQEERTCYNTVSSSDIIQEAASLYQENRISKFPVRFLSKDNWIIGQRYTILVKQYVQSRAAYQYYEALKTLSSSESVLSQLQTGFLEGNVRSESSKNGNVIGYFQVSSVSTKRIFFNYQDYFPGEISNNYAFDCELITPNLTDIGGGSYLIYGIDFHLFVFYDFNPGNTNNPFFMAYPSACGDCTQLGSNVMPDFWVE